jgi:protein PhnA
MDAKLLQRSQMKCELCGATGSLQEYAVGPESATKEDINVVLCEKCLAQVNKKEALDSGHWACLATAMWSEVPAVQVLSWRLLNRLNKESWAADLLDMLYLEEERLSWAKASGDHESDGLVELHKDCNGNTLQEGDTVVLIKSLDVKGSTLNAKMGTVVKNIRLVENNTEQIEGKIEGQVIVILTKYVRKQG